MNISPQMQGIGCVSSLLNLGALVSGIYQGMTDARGMPIDPTTKTLIRYGPIAIGGALGMAAAQIVGKDGSLDELMADAPVEIEKGCMQGCAVVAYPILSAAVTAGFEYLGYAIGHTLGK